MNRDYLKQYITSYGGIEVIKDIASVMQELSQEWAETNKSLAFTFSDASFTLADVSAKLELAQLNYDNQNIDAPTLDYAKYHLEFNKLMHYFQSLSIKDLQKAYSKNKSELVSKLKRLDFLKKLLNIKDNSKK